MQVLGERRAAAGGARPRAAWPGAAWHRACRRSRGTVPARGVRPARPVRSPDRCRAHRRSRRPGRSSSRARHLVGLVEAASHDHRVARRLERLRQPARRAGTTWPRPAARGRPGTRAGRSNADPRPSSARGRRPGNRRMAGQAEPPRLARPRLPGVADPDPRASRRSRGLRPSSAGGRSSRSGEAGSHRSVPVHAVSSPNAAATSPGPLASRVVWHATDPRGVGGGLRRASSPCGWRTRGRSGRRASGRALRAARRRAPGGRPENRPVRSRR